MSHYSITSPPGPPSSPNNEHLVPSLSTSSTSTYYTPPSTPRPSDQPTNKATPVVPANRQWPMDFYAVKFCDGFLKVDQQMKILYHTIDVIFKNVFSSEFAPNTYYTNRAYWNTLSERVRDEVIHAGRTTGGQYSELTKAHPMMDSTQRVTRNRYARALAAQDYQGGRLKRQKPGHQ
ncbi:hypothetical protein BDN67DRAFT_1017801 [Paxillus ammoniavirescens]|nr:hypothetical protein BDN67DRAFT_1017801 [Paxillus ammoniavirescens]